jgi:hypothetical protein
VNWLILEVAAWLDTRAYYLQQHTGWRLRLGWALERLAFSWPVRWAWRRYQ